MFWRNSPLFLLVPLAVLLAILIGLAPPEQSLGNNVRIVYLHGAWVWTSLLGFGVSACLSLVGLATGWPKALDLAQSLAKTATVFWVTYLPLSLWAMQANWNGLFLAEPRWRLGLDFAVIGLLAQAAIHVIDRSRFAAAVNLAFPLLLFFQLSRAKSVMHPSSPIFSSESGPIQVFFLLLTAVCLLIAWQLTRWFQRPLTRKHA